MKKILLAAMTVLLLLLSACQSPADPAESPAASPAPSPTQSAETSPAPAPSADPVPSRDPISIPTLLDEFDFPKVEALVLSGSELTYIHTWLTEDELAELKASLQMETWWEATDVPEMGLEPLYALTSGENDTGPSNSFLVDKWDENTCLVLAKQADSSEIYLYYAPISVLETYEQYLSGKNLLPDFVRYFEMDQVNVNGTPAEDGDYFLDHEVYLLDDEAQLSMLSALAPDTWTMARDESELAVSWSSAMELLDPQGNQVVLVGWGEDKCLVNCFFADTDVGPGAVVRYWAPASVLKNAQDLVDGLTSLGTIDNTAARYYDLFWSDPGFDALFELADKSGRISDDQMAAYALVRLAYEGSFDSEVGVSTKTIDRFTQTYFGRVMNSYDTSMSKTLPSGNVTPTGWDIGGSRSLVLTGTPEEDEYGNISATFLVYVLGEETWIDGTMDPVLLDHIREYVLTGNTDEYPDPIQVSVTFRIDTDHWYGVPREYLVYDAVRREYRTYDAGV